MCTFCFANNGLRNRLLLECGMKPIRLNNHRLCLCHLSFHKLRNNAVTMLYVFAVRTIVFLFHAALHSLALLGNKSKTVDDAAHIFAATIVRIDINPDGTCHQNQGHQICVQLFHHPLILIPLLLFWGKDTKKDFKVKTKKDKKAI